MLAHNTIKTPYCSFQLFFMTLCHFVSHGRRGNEVFTDWQVPTGHPPISSLLVPGLIFFRTCLLWWYRRAYVHSALPFNFTFRSYHFLILFLTNPTTLIIFNILTLQFMLFKPPQKFNFSFHTNLCIHFSAIQSASLGYPSSSYLS